ncbi:MAG: hypothetical protein AB1756_00185 [Acidobacteriota bacterium]
MDVMDGMEGDGEEEEVGGQVGPLQVLPPDILTLDLVGVVGDQMLFMQTRVGESFTHHKFIDGDGKHQNLMRKRISKQRCNG